MTPGDPAFALTDTAPDAAAVPDYVRALERAAYYLDDAQRAQRLAAELSEINAQRQELQSAMVEQGEAMVTAFLARHRDVELPYGVVLHEPDWHPGVVGLVASKLKERLHRPVIACAPAEPGAMQLRASARSIPGFHLRDALAEVDAR